MHIKEGSWHQRIYSNISCIDYDSMQHLQSRGRLNFCKYARTIGIALMIATIVAIIGAFTLFCMGCTWVAFLIHGSAWLALKSPDFFFFGAAQVGVVLNIIAAFGVVAWLSISGIQKYKEKKRERDYARRHSDAPTKEPGFVSTWFESVKHKFCPMMTFDAESQI